MASNPRSVQLTTMDLHEANIFNVVNDHSCTTFSSNDVDVYLQPLIDELLLLWKGVKTIDASTKKEFPFRAALLWTINDFPALAYLYVWTTSGTYACPSCGPATK
jgi:hypothetical protein